MTLRECYEFMEGDYDDVMARFGKEEIVIKFLRKYTEKDEMLELKKMLAEKRYKDAFLSTHDMKGYGLNMSLIPFQKAASELCELLRNGKPTVDTTPYVEKLDAAHKKLYEALEKLD